MTSSEIFSPYKFQKSLKKARMALKKSLLYFHEVKKVFLPFFKQKKFASLFRSKFTTFFKRFFLTSKASNNQSLIKECFFLGQSC